MKVKKILVLLLVGVVLTTLVACNNSTNAPADTEDNSEGNLEDDSKDAAENTSNGDNVITFAHVSAESTSTHQGALKFKELVEENSNGELKVDIYPNAQLGGDRELIEGTQNNQMTMMISSPAPQVNFVKSATIFDLPFVFRDLDHGRAVLDDPDFMEAIGSEYEKSGFEYLGASGQGFRTLTANKKITSPEDLKGVTIRTMENKYHMETWNKLGANATPLPFNELYTALQQGVADAQENPVELVHSQKFYEQQDYIMNINHILQTNTWIMNKDFYNGLSEELQKVVDEAAKEAIDFTNEYNDKNEAKYIKDIEDYGCEFIELTPEQLSKFSEKCESVYNMIKEDTEPEVYETYFKAIEANE